MRAVAQVRVGARAGRAGEATAVDLDLQHRTALAVAEPEADALARGGRGRRPESIVGAGGAIASTVHVRVTELACSLGVQRADLERVRAVGEVRVRLGRDALCSRRRRSGSRTCAVPSVSEKLKLTFLPEVEAAAGPESIVGTAGGLASTVHVLDAAARVCRACRPRGRSVCEPSPRLVYAFGAGAGDERAGRACLEGDGAFGVGEVEADARAGGRGRGGAAVEGRDGRRDRVDGPGPARWRTRCCRGRRGRGRRRCASRRSGRVGLRGSGARSRRRRADLERRRSFLSEKPKLTLGPEVEPAAGPVSMLGAGGRDRVGRPRAAGRGAGVAVRVEGADVEGMRAVGEVAVGLRRGSRAVAAVVDLDFEGGPALGVAEAEADVLAGGGGCGRAGVDGRQRRRDGVDGPGATVEALECCRRRRARGPGRCASRRRGCCRPSAKRRAKPPPSIWTSNVAVPSVSEKPKLTFLPEVEAAAGPESIVGSAGATRPQSRSGDRGAECSRKRRAHAPRRCASRRSGWSSSSAKQQSCSRRRRSATSNVAVPSVSEKAKETFLPVVEAAAGPESIVGSAGAVASTVHVRDVTVETLPYASNARTSKVCEPSPRLG